jgi:hypothetical protein
MAAADWMAVLERVRDALEQTVVESSRHEDMLASPLMADSSDDANRIAWRQAIDRLEERLKAGQALVESATAKAGGAEAAIAEQEEIIRRFQVRLNDVSQRLTAFVNGLQ